MIDTSRVDGRCKRRFESLDEVLAECQRLAQVPTRQLGNWSLAQICEHLGKAMQLSTTNQRAFPVPWHLRLFGPLVRRRVLARGLPRGFQLPPEGAPLLPDPVAMEAGLATLSAGMDALRATTRRNRHPVFGALNVEQWNQFHLRHAEMHLSFIVPVEQAAARAES